MVKNIILIFIAITFLIACNSKQTEQVKKANASVQKQSINTSNTSIQKQSTNTSNAKESVEQQNEKTPIRITKLLNEPGNYLDKPITTIGIVDHVCRHSGKKMVIFEDKPDQSLHVMASNKVKQFKAEVMGNNVVVKGIFKENRIPKSRLLEYKKTFQGKDHVDVHGNENVKVKKEEEEKKHQRQSREKSIDNMLAAIEKSGKDYYSTYYIQCSSYSIKE